MKLAIVHVQSEEEGYVADRERSLNLLCLLLFLNSKEVETTSLQDAIRSTFCLLR